VDGLDKLTLTGVQGATIQQPNTPPPPHPAFVLSVWGLLLLLSLCYIGNPQAGFG